ncbi:MAG: hypothetical protein F6K24_10860 [Okeania sp. SIO2D1]|nr:hypothetical protein [Okeania sp. SIO2D1]
MQYNVFFSEAINKVCGVFRNGKQSQILVCHTLCVSHVFEYIETANLKFVLDNLKPTAYNLKPITYNLKPITYNLKPTTYNLNDKF